MDVKSFIEKSLKKAVREQQLAFERYNENKKRFKDTKEAFELNEYPESTGVLESLKAHIGKPVIIECRYNESVTENLNYDPELKRVLIGNGWSTHIMSDTIKKITDAKTGEVIFENPYDKNLSPLQVAKIFGKAEGLKSLKNEEEDIERSKKWAQETFEGTKKALESIPGWIERGKPLVYPEKFDKWTECVCYRATDLYHGLELVNAMEVMEALDKGLSLDEVGKVISEHHSGTSYGMLVNIVTHFSKRGPEFYRAFSSSYQYKLKNGSKKDIKETQEWLNNLEKENATYEENQKNGSQPNN